MLLPEVLAHLSPAPGEVFIDATLGGAGHAAAVAERLGPQGRLLGIDRDPEALEAARQRLQSSPGAICIAKGNFNNIIEIASNNGCLPCNGMVADLGVSSHQLDTAHRGFSFAHESPLDMRMDPEAPVSAQVLLERCGQSELAGILRRLGEERYADRIARAIKGRGKLRTTTELAALVDSVVPKRGRGRLHPATRTFQALRIAVNQELESLQTLLEALPQLLAPGGRVVIISFHSLEDRLVKKAFFRLSANCTCAPELPVCQCGGVADYELVSRRVVRPTSREIESNPRARSARLRSLRRKQRA